MDRCSSSSSSSSCLVGWWQGGRKRVLLLLRGLVPAGHINKLPRSSHLVCFVSLMLALEDDVLVGGQVVATEEEVEEEELSEE